MLHHATGAGVFEAPASPLFERAEAHPENAERISNPRSVLLKGPLANQLDWTEAPVASAEQMLRFHDAAYLDSLRAVPDGESVRVTETTVLSPGSWLAMTAAAGQAIAAVRHVRQQDDPLAYLPDPTEGVEARIDEIARRWRAAASR